jgi:hypothetical protein
MATDFPHDALDDEVTGFTCTACGAAYDSVEVGDQVVVTPCSSAPPCPQCWLCFEVLVPGQSRRFDRPVAPSSSRIPHTPDRS